jgi:hypothetical protein
LKIFSAEEYFLAPCSKTGSKKNQSQAAGGKADLKKQKDLFLPTKSA